MSKMKRRDFLKLIGAGTVGTVLPFSDRSDPLARFPENNIAKKVRDLVAQGSYSLLFDHEAFVLLAEYCEQSVSRVDFKKKAAQS